MISRTQNVSITSDLTPLRMSKTWMQKQLTVHTPKTSHNIKSQEMFLHKFKLIYIIYNIWTKPLVQFSNSPSHGKASPGQPAFVAPLA